MESNKRKRRLIFAICIFGIIALTFLWWKGGLDRVMAADSTGRAKAEALVAAYAKHVGVHDAVHQTLDADDDRSFGDFGFHYFSGRKVIQARVYIMESREKQNAEERPNRPELVASEKKVDAALNDPKIGGMYDRGGGYFFTDQNKQIVFLAKDYSLPRTTSAEFIRDVDNLNSLAGIWLMSWMGHVAVQTLGGEPLPPHFVTRENDPYKR